MLQVTDVSLQFAGTTLYKEVDLKFTEGNCYGIIGANGSGKSTLLKVLYGAMEPTTGTVSLKQGCRLSVLEQDHFKYDDKPIMETVLMGNPQMYEIIKEKERLYSKEDFSTEDGEKVAELEEKFSEMGGWEAEDEAAALLRGLGLTDVDYHSYMSELTGKQKVKVLSGGEKVRCMFSRMMMSSANVVLLDQPTNHLDLESIAALTDGLEAFKGNVLLCTHDHQLIDTVANRIIELPMPGESRCIDYTGTFEEFLEWKERAN